MVGNTTLLHIHQRLKEIYGSAEIFADKSVYIVVGDLYQLPPIKKKAVFENYKITIFVIH